MNRLFMPPPAATFRYRKGRQVSDNDLLRAWSHVSTARLEAMPPDTTDDRFVVNAARQRVLSLRKAREAKR